MRAAIDDKMLSIPFGKSPLRMALLLHMILVADEYGIVRVTPQEIAASTNIPLPTICAYRDEFFAMGLIRIDADVWQFIPNRFFKFGEQLEKKRKNKTTSATVTTVPSAFPEVTTVPSVSPEVTTVPSASPEVTTVPSASPEVTTVHSDSPEGIQTRIAKFIATFKKELATWLSKDTSRIFPDGEQKKFIEYWTAHNEKDRKFRAELEKKFYWQSRLSTWMPVEKQKKLVMQENRSRYRDIKAQSISQDMENNMRKLEESRAAYEKSDKSWLEGKPLTMSPIDWLHELKRRAVYGDEEAKQKLASMQKK